MEKLLAYKAEKGWEDEWVSSFESDFNYDFHVTIDPERASNTYNYREAQATGEMPETSVFFRLDDQVYHTYSCFQRAGERMTDAYSLLDITPFGRQEDFEDSPDGWPQRPTYG